MTAPPESGPVPRIDVVGLGPAGPELLTTDALVCLGGPAPVVLRTARHPAAVAVPGAATFDDRYESGETFEAVYHSIVEELVARAVRDGAVTYAVPGSPLVAERTVDLLREAPAVVAGQVVVAVHPGLSFLDLAYARLGVDPVAAGVRLVDGTVFAADAAGQRGPLLVAQCWSPGVLSEVKLAVEAPPGTTATLLHHLGLPDERVVEVPWAELDRTLAPDHLTSVWIPALAEPVGAELVRLDELVHDLRQRCPWDRVQTHGSLARHLMEEAYEVLEALDAVAAVDGAGGSGEGAGAVEGTGRDPAEEERAVAHLEEELGDLLFQVYFHATLAAEAGRFTLADVARGIHDKLVSRHPALFAAAGDGGGGDPEQLDADWETLKKREKNRSSVTEGIPAALPALALAAKLQRKGTAVGLEAPEPAAEAAAVTAAVDRLVAPVGPSGGDGPDPAAGHAVGEALFALVGLARRQGVDPEGALRARAAAFRTAVEAAG